MSVQLVGLYHILNVIYFLMLISGAFMWYISKRKSKVAKIGLVFMIFSSVLFITQPIKQVSNTYHKNEDITFDRRTEESNIKSDIHHGKKFEEVLRNDTESFKNKSKEILKEVK